MKEEGESDEELYKNEPTIWAGNREDSISIEESTCASQPMIGTNEDGSMAPWLKPSYSSLTRRQPSDPVTTPPIVVSVA